MALWSNDNTTYPSYLDTKQKRNVVRTPQGWVRISKRNGSPNELLVAVANVAAMPTSTIKQMWHTGSTGLTATSPVNTAITTIVTFDQPIQSLGGGYKITVANTAGGSAKTGTSPSTIYEGNKIKFTWTPTVAGTYKIQAQTIANSSASAVSLRSTTGNGNTAVSLVISGTVSNTASTIVVS